MIKTLLGNSSHNTSITAYVFPDWPYGRQLRCEKRVWVETNGNKGQRIAEQTTNPKAGNKLNKPHYGTYSEVVLFGEDAEGKLEIMRIHYWDNPAANIEAALSLPLDDQQHARLLNVRKISRAGNPEAWTRYADEQSAKALIAASLAA